MRPLHTLVAATIVAAVVLALLTAAPGTPGASAQELRTFDGCGALIDELRSQALADVGPWGLEEPYAVILESGADVAVEEAAPAAGAEAPAADGSAAAPTSDTGTNVQVEGVDEADHVKLVGDRLVVVDEQDLLVFDVSAEAPRRVGALSLGKDLWPTSLLVSGDRLVVLGTVHVDVDDVAVAGDAIRPGPIHGAATGVAVVDLADPTAPRVVDRATVRGDLVAGRTAGGAVLLVTTDRPALPFVHPSSDDEDALRTAEEANRRAIASSPLEQWLPTVTSADGSQRALVDCGALALPDDVERWGSVALTRFDPTRPLAEMSAGGTFGGGETVYATAERVYVAAHLHDEVPRTAVHAFAVEARPRYLASGSVDGHLLNQFAMDRHEGHLRVATTRPGPDGVSESQVAVLAEDGRRLTVVGAVGGLGRTETIRSVRFMGPIGFVVTFRQTDPLYTLDLSEPTSPRVPGELKIEGYSGYLHPIADGRLLGVGRSATPDGMITGAQVSLFDVTDLSGPRRLDVLELPGAETPVEWDHHAFTWVADAQVAAMPLSEHGMPTPMPMPEPELGTSGEPAIAPSEPLPGSPPADVFAGLLLVEVTDDRLALAARVAGPERHGWPEPMSRTVVHDGTLLAVGGGEVWRVGFDGTVLGTAAVR